MNYPQEGCYEKMQLVFNRFNQTRIILNDLEKTKIYAYSYDGVLGLDIGNTGINIDTDLKLGLLDINREIWKENTINISDNFKEKLIINPLVVECSRN